MKLVCADADFSAQAKLESVGKAGAGIDHHAGGVNFTQKLLRMNMVAGNDGVGVVA